MKGTAFAVFLSIYCHTGNLEFWPQNSDLAVIDKYREIDDEMDDLKANNTDKWRGDAAKDAD